ncbi:MAG: hypothetical protein A2Y12_03495 [Planctomycetes bacterium GWF2_42_9]|nr:MAG: hypothetical protein A2Y12_03495 [Planctomycetes bacterium GWF2_42_9]
MLTSRQMIAVPSDHGNDIKQSNKTKMNKYSRARRAASPNYAFDLLQDQRQAHQTVETYYSERKRAASPRNAVVFPTKSINHNSIYYIDHQPWEGENGI